MCGNEPVRVYLLPFDFVRLWPRDSRASIFNIIKKERERDIDLDVPWIWLKKKKSIRFFFQLVHPSRYPPRVYSYVAAIIERYSRGLHSNSNIKREFAFKDCIKVEQSPLSRIPSVEHHFANPPPYRSTRFLTKLKIPPSFSRLSFDYYQSIIHTCLRSRSNLLSRRMKVFSLYI